MKIALRMGQAVSLFLILNACAGIFAPQATIRGTVIDRETLNPVAGALVCIRATENRVTTNDDGSFELRIPASDQELEVTAWLPGYYIAYVKVLAPASGLTLELRRYHTQDNPDYEWVNPQPNPDLGTACGNCHVQILPQWEAEAHSGAISNPRFFSFYNGTDISGESSVAPGYTLDFPGTTGNCANCHAPGAAIDAPFNTDMNAVRGEIAAGIHCDFCHKIAGVYLQPTSSEAPDSAVLYPNMPGVLSLMVLRPPEGEQIFLGPYPDIHDPDTYLPMMSESQYCAPCHQFSFWGTEVYGSYREWSESAYAQQGVTCQNCHMAPTGDEYYALPEQGGLPHPAETIPSHLQLGVKDETFMQASVDLEVTIERDEGRLTATTILTNATAGHHVPTDHPGRHLLLVVQVVDSGGAYCRLLEGPTIPEWGGSLAGNPGVGYAKILRDAVTGESPVVSYWKPTLLVSDNRIPALESHTTHFEFEACGPELSVEVRVIFRRLFEPLADQYGWDLTEIELASVQIPAEGTQ